MTSESEYPLVMDAFAIRQFNNPDYTGTQVDYDIKLFEQKVNEFYATGAHPLVDGYAPFCKHLFIPNFAAVKCGYAKITDLNRGFLKSGYEARKENELAVLIQWLDQSAFPAPEATFLDIILYRYQYRLLLIQSCSPIELTIFLAANR
jgi:hypothetical protein